MRIEHFGRYSVELSNTDKVLFPDSGISKGELIDYYRQVAGVMLPHMKDRPLTLHRFPDGIEEEGFYQQARSDYFPDWIKTRKTPRANQQGDSIEHVLCNNQATLVYLANQAVITPHGWLSRAPALSKPDRLIFDLDPSNNDFQAVRDAARQVVGLMQDLGLAPHVMTTGSRGLHVVAPLQADTGFDEVRELARNMAELLAQRHSETLTVEQRKNKRGARIYLDVMRNAYGQTSVMPYAVRAKPGAPVATPLALDEIEESQLDPRGWHLKNVLRRLAQKDDPWKTIQQHGVSVQGVRQALDKLKSE